MRFQGKYRFLSNFFPALVWMEGYPYTSVEHAYQASKTDVKKERSDIRNMVSSGEAKLYGRHVKLREDWEAKKELIMEELLRQKFRWPEMRSLLVNTDPEFLVEGNTWHDNFWGVCLCGRCESSEGLNKLGKLLMKIRQEMVM